MKRIKVTEVDTIYIDDVQAAVDSFKEKSTAVIDLLATFSPDTFTIDQLNQAVELASSCNKFALLCISEVCL